MCVFGTAQGSKPLTSLSKGGLPHSLYVIGLHYHGNDNAVYVLRHSPFTLTGELGITTKSIYKYMSMRSTTSTRCRVSLII